MISLRNRWFNIQMRDLSVKDNGMAMNTLLDYNIIEFLDVIK